MADKALSAAALVLAAGKSGGGSGTSNYNSLTNKPLINNVELTGNKTTADLGINIPTKTSDLTNDSGFLTEHQSLANYSTTTEMNTAISNHHDSTKQDTLSSDPAVGNVIAPLYVDTGELRIELGNGVHKTSDDALEVEVKSEGGITLDANGISVDTSVIQPKLTAGSNITISNNTISATDTTYTAGTNITIDANNVISATGGGSSYTAGDGIEIANNTISLDDEYVEGMTVEGAYQLISNDGVLQDSSFISRTTGGSASISAEGTATLVRISGNSTNPTYVEEAWNDGGATVDHQVFAAKVTNGGSYTFTKVNDNWQLAGVNVDLSEYGITGVDALTEFTVVYTKANAGTIINATPTSFTSLGFNLYDHTNTRAYVIEGNRYQVFGTYTSVGTETIVDDYVVGSYTIPHSFVASTTGYVSVVGGNSTDTMIALVWSGYNYAHTYEAYEATTISLTDVTGWGMPRVNGVADEIDFEKQKYIKRIGRDVVANASLYGNKIVDSTYVYYVLSDAVETTVSYSKTYTANDFGEEIFAGTQVACEFEVLYGQNLKDKLRTDVVTISEQSLTTAQLNLVKTNLGISASSWDLSDRIRAEDGSRAVSMGYVNTSTSSDPISLTGNSTFIGSADGTLSSSFQKFIIAKGDGNLITGSTHSRSGVVINSSGTKSGNLITGDYTYGIIDLGGDMQGNLISGHFLGNATYGNALGIGTALGCSVIGDFQGSGCAYISGYGSSLCGYGTGTNTSGIDKDTAFFTAHGTAARAIGYNTKANSGYQLAMGKFNVADSANTYALIIGNGTSNTARSNALTVDWSGNLVCNNIPAPPSTDGTYQLTCTVSSGVATYSWVSAT